MASAAGWAGCGAARQMRGMEAADLSQGVCSACCAVVLRQRPLHRREAVDEVHAASSRRQAQPLPRPAPHKSIILP